MKNKEIMVRGSDGILEVFKRDDDGAYRGEMKFKERDIAIQAINMIEIYMYQTGEGVISLPKDHSAFIDWAKRNYKITDKDIPFWNWRK